jgi:hypothetical protein
MITIRNLISNFLFHLSLLPPLLPTNLPHSILYPWEKLLSLSLNHCPFWSWWISTCFWQKLGSHHTQSSHYLLGDLHTTSSPTTPYYVWQKADPRTLYLTKISSCSVDSKTD